MRKTSSHLLLTKHAQTRCQQRGIPREAIDVVYRFGKHKRTRSGGFSYSMNNEGRRCARRHLPAADCLRIADKLDLYIGIAPDGITVTTVAHRQKRLKLA